MSLIQQFSESADSYRGSQERNERSRDVSAYQDMRHLAEDASTSAVNILKEYYPDVLKTYELAVSDDEASMEAAHDIGKLKKSKPEVYSLAIKSSLGDELQQIQEAVHLYVEKVHQHEAFELVAAKQLSPESQHAREDKGKVRSQAHDALISKLNIFIRHCEEAGLDTSWKSVVGFHGNSYRREEIQRWAEHVADYLATVSESTE